LWLRPFFVGVCLRPALLAALALPLGVVWGALGHDYGVPELFWHEDPWVQLLAGLGVSLLVANVCFTAWLLDQGKDQAPGPREGRLRRLAERLTKAAAPDPPSAARAAGSAADEGEWVRFRRYLSATWLSLTLLLALSTAAYPAAHFPCPAADGLARGRSWWTESPPGPWLGRSRVFAVPPHGCLVFGLLRRWPFLLGVLLSVAVVRSLVVLFHRLPAGDGAAPLTRGRPAWRTHAAVAGAFFAALSVLLLADGPPLLLCFLLGVWPAVHGFLAARAAVRRQPPGERWRHRLAALAFAAWWLAYEMLFLFYWADASGSLSPWSSPPALALCLLLGLPVAAYGFLKHHLGGGAGPLAAALLAAGVLVNSLSEFKLHFPGLEEYYQRDRSDRVALAEADFDALFARVLADQGLTPREKALRLRRPLGNLRARGRALAEALGTSHPAFEERPEPNDPRAVKSRYDEADRALLRLELLRLERWKEQAARGGKRPRLAVVAVSGGGARAALWSAVVLDRLERTLPGFPRRLRVITGASGAWSAPPGGSPRSPGPATTRSATTARSPNGWPETP
jgi:hypothetical protein